MGVTHFIRKLPHRKPSTSYYYLREWMTRQLAVGQSRWGPSVYTRDWDVLVILDACRVDLLQSVSDEYEWLPDEINSVPSIAGSSKEWMERTFLDDDYYPIQQTAYISGNPFTATVFEFQNPLARLDHSWRDAWDDDLGTVRPEPLVDRTIRTGREHDGPIIVHLMQPHIPFIGDTDLHPGFDPDKWGDPAAVRAGTAQQPNVWQQLRMGELDEDRVWGAYQDNLRVALDAVARLRNNISGTLVLSADHGNAMGEGGVFGHPNVPVEPIRDVPWVELEAVDERTHTPSVERSDAAADVEQRLQALGYAEGSA